MSEHAVLQFKLCYVPDLILCITWF